MSSRRDFIRSGAFAMGAIASGGVVRAADSAVSSKETSNSTLPLYMAVFDDRLTHSTAFAAQARLRGVRTESLDRGDVTSLWYDNLYHRWKEGPAAIAGLTTPDALFVLETFGNDAGLRLRFKAEHREREDFVEHRLYGPAAALRGALRLESSGACWSADMARILSKFRDSSQARSSACLTSRLGAPSRGDSPLLVSWILAPRHAFSTSMRRI